MHDKWLKDLPGLTKRYAEGAPFPHIRLLNFLEAGAAEELAGSFTPKEGNWITYRHFSQNTLGLTGRIPLLNRFLEPSFLHWLTALTGIRNLIGDPTFEGGGLHQTKRGGFLNVHSDFSHHPYQKNWKRRCNVLLYLNHEWEESWGGAIELWDKKMKSQRSYPPLFNSALIFETNSESLHGYPAPLECPPSVTRKSLALYYYSLEEKPSRPIATKYHSRSHRLLTQIDNGILATYSALRRKKILSDRFTSYVQAVVARPKAEAISWVKRTTRLLRPLSGARNDY